LKIQAGWRKSENNLKIKFRYGASLKAASILAFYMFFLALGGYSPYSARRAWAARLEAGSRAGNI
jgi:hypothetical protein